MELISFLNNQFWGDSSYMVLLTLSLIMILWNKKKNARGKTMALYSILVLVLIIYNPFVAPFGLHFFAGDRWAYMRIFYLLPLMPVISYALSDFYSDMVDITEPPVKKIKFLAAICIIIILCGEVFDSSMYRKAENLYKIDPQALEIGQTILENSGEQKVRALLPDQDDIVYGIRQYTGDIVIAGHSNEVLSENTLKDVEENYDFQYIVIGKDKSVLRLLEQHSYQYISSTEEYYVLVKEA